MGHHLLFLLQNISLHILIIFSLQHHHTFTERHINFLAPLHFQVKQSFNINLVTLYLKVSFHGGLALNEQRGCEVTANLVVWVQWL